MAIYIVIWLQFPNIFIARDLSVAEDTVRGWIREKKLPAYRVGKEYRIKIVDYERFLQQRRTIDDDLQEGD